MQNKIQKRKYDHFNICLNNSVEAKNKTTCFEDIMLVHRAFSQVDIEDIKLSTTFLGKKFSYPFMIASITGGFKKSLEINKNLASAAEELNIGMGIGSQRIALEENKTESFYIIRDYAPTTFIYANIGISQILSYDIEIFEKIVNMIDADALAIHFNLLQELIQPEGKLKLKNCVEKIKEITKELKVPVFVKEVGCGFSRDDIAILQNTGIKAVDVGGLGGTSWSAIEYYRSKNINNHSREKIGSLFWDFGIPTALSIIECQSSLPIVATGGIRSGLDIAKSIALGASIASSALPFVSLSLKGKKEIIKYIKQLMKELKVSMLITGNSSLRSLSKTPLVITGFAKEYINQRKLNINNYNIRSI